MTYVGKTFSDMGPGEIRTRGFDFTNELAVNESALTSSWTCTVKDGVDNAASSRLVGVATLVDNISSQQIGPLTPGVTYILRAEVVTSFGNKLHLWSYQKCIQP